MTGYHQYHRLIRIEEKARDLGFRITNSPWSPHESGISLAPRDEELPIYSRDASLFTGSMEEAEFFLYGIEWARKYDELMKVSSAKIRLRKEQDERNVQLANLLKNSGVPKETK